MASEIFNLSMQDNMIERLVQLLLERETCQKNDFSRIACVFGGKRPGLFLKRELAKRLKKSFVPPAVFSIDQFMQHVVRVTKKQDLFNQISDLEAAYLLYQQAQKVNSSIIKGRESFHAFLPWAQEIISFIEQVDLEEIQDLKLSSIEKSASIGYEIPENINLLLSHIVVLRKAYHALLEKNNLYSRGTTYLQAAQLIASYDYRDFDLIIFCGFYYLHASECKVMKEVYSQGKAVYIFQGDEKQWPVLRNNAKNLDVKISSQGEDTFGDFKLYQGFDLHSQVGIVRKILEDTQKENTVVVLPKSDALIPLLSQVSKSLGEFNVSMGYPLMRSSIYSLFNLIFKVEESKRKDSYYMKDYLELIKHPFIKNIKFTEDAAVTRVLVHKLEECITGKIASKISGSLFLSLSALENEETIIENCQITLDGMGVKFTKKECHDVLKALHQLVFKIWQDVDSFAVFSQKLKCFLDLLIDKSLVGNFSFNLKCIDKLYDLVKDLSKLSFARQEFPAEDIWDIFSQKLKQEKVSFIGSPLRGTQILGLLETRSLKFDKIIIMDLNEAVLPKLQVYEPLIPREIMLSLGLNRLEKEEEIQRYHFMRLLSGAKDVHLVYIENRETEKSRFIEFLLWQKQQKEKVIDVVMPYRIQFPLEQKNFVTDICKTQSIVNYLKKSVYSPSRLNTYLNCPRQFYYQYVLGLEEKQEFGDAVEAKYVGTFIHELLEETFLNFLGKNPVIDNKFKKYFFKVFDEKFEREIVARMRSDSFLLKGIIERRMDSFLEIESKRSIEKIVSLEKTLTSELNFCHSPIKFTSTIDRIDQLDSKRVMIIDYKTGSTNVSPKKLSALSQMEMTRESIRDNLKSFQLPLYYHFVKEAMPDMQINAELYNLRTLERKSFIDEDDYADVEELMKICFTALEHIFSEIFDLNLPFIADREIRRCQYCAFKEVC